MGKLHLIQWYHVIFWVLCFCFVVNVVDIFIRELILLTLFSELFLKTVPHIPQLHGGKKIKLWHNGTVPHSLKWLLWAIFLYLNCNKNFKMLGQRRFEPYQAQTTLPCSACQLSFCNPLLLQIRVEVWQAVISSNPLFQSKVWCKTHSHENECEWKLVLTLKDLALHPVQEL